MATCSERLFNIRSNLAFLAKNAARLSSGVNVLGIKFIFSRSISCAIGIAACCALCLSASLATGTFRIKLSNVVPLLLATIKVAFSSSPLKYNSWSLPSLALNDFIAVHQPTMAATASRPRSTNQSPAASNRSTNQSIFSSIHSSARVAISLILLPTRLMLT